jgi:TonB family protein
MRVLKGFLHVTILFLFMSCENTEKKSAPIKMPTKTLIQKKPKFSKPSNKVKKPPRFIPPEILPVRFDPDPDPPGPFPYDPGEPPVYDPLYNPVNEPIKANEDTIYDFPTFMPQFPGGQQALINYLKTNLVYPEDAKELGIEGKVFVSFVIFEDGSIQQVSILRGINGNKSCEKEALRLIKQMPKWIPAQNEYGQIIKGRMKIPVIFRLD